MRNRSLKGFNLDGVFRVHTRPGKFLTNRIAVVKVLLEEGAGPYE